MLLDNFDQLWHCYLNLQVELIGLLGKASSQMRQTAFSFVLADSANITYHHLALVNFGEFDVTCESAGRAARNVGLGKQSNESDNVFVQGSRGEDTAQQETLSFEELMELTKVSQPVALMLCILNLLRY